MFAVISGILGIYEVKNNQKENPVYDVAMFEGVSYLGSLMFGLKDAGMWGDKRGTNLLDGGAPFYRCYETKDSKYIAVGALESKFFKELIETLDLPLEMIEEQMMFDKWSSHVETFSKVFLSKSRDEWSNIFVNTDCCVTPVLTLDEARKHPHPVSRDSYLDNFPRGNNMIEDKHSQPIVKNINEIFEELNISKNFIEELEKNGTLSIE
jgi:alpha-methylacyl-CoA racemase